MIEVKNDRVIITSDRGVVGIAADLTQKESGCFFEGVAIICEQTNEDISKGRKQNGKH